jgi:hypothetical protein
VKHGPQKNDEAPDVNPIRKRDLLVRKDISDYRIGQIRCFRPVHVKSVKPRIRNTVRHVEEPWLSQSEIKICTAGSHELGNCHVLIADGLGLSHRFTHDDTDLVGSRQTHLIEKGLAIREVTVRGVR